MDRIDFICPFLICGRISGGASAHKDDVRNRTGICEIETHRGRIGIGAKRYRLAPAPFMPLA
jgi:hypothetical protein